MTSTRQIMKMRLKQADLKQADSETTTLYMKNDCVIVSINLSKKDNFVICLEVIILNLLYM